MIEHQKNILDLLRARNQTGISMLYQNYSKSLYGIAVRVVSDQGAAEDILQKSFLKIWNNINQYDESKAAFFTWMAQIVRNTAIDVRRLKANEVSRKSESFQAHVHDNEKDFIKTDKIDAAKLVNGLDEKYSAVIELLYLRGYSQSEAAKALDVPLGTIKTRVKKAMDILREKLKDEKSLLFRILFSL